MSKPLHQPTDKTRAEIIALRSYGVPIKEVAAYIGIDDKTLCKYYREELENSEEYVHTAGTSGTDGIYENTLMMFSWTCNAACRSSQSFSCRY